VSLAFTGVIPHRERDFTAVFPQRKGSSRQTKCVSPASSKSATRRPTPGDRDFSAGDGHGARIAGNHGVVEWRSAFLVSIRRVERDPRSFALRQRVHARGTGLDVVWFGRVWGTRDLRNAPASCRLAPLTISPNVCIAIHTASHFIRPLRPNQENPTHEVPRRFAYRRRWLILAVWVVLFLGMNALSSPSAPPMRTRYAAGDQFDPRLSLLQSGLRASPATSTRSSFKHERARSRVTERNPRDGQEVEKVASVANVVSPFVGGSLQISKNGKIAYSWSISPAGVQAKEQSNSTRRERGISARSSSLNVQFAGNAFENLASQRAVRT